MNNICDAVTCAAQTGRLDLVSALLACIGILLVLGGIFGFLNIRTKASSVAQEVAREEAKKVAESVANVYIQENLPKILESYRELIEKQVNSAVADQIALSQELV